LKKKIEKYLTCVYNAPFSDKNESGAFCIPPDELYSIKCNCENCHFYCEFINSEIADNFINQTFKNEYKLSEKYYFFYPTIRRMLEKGTTQIDSIFFVKSYSTNEIIDISDLKEQEIKEIFVIANQYMRMLNSDIISQIINLSTVWQHIKNIYLNKINFASMGGAGNSVSWIKEIFGKDFNELSIIQLKILELTLIYEKITANYSSKHYCKYCFEHNQKTVQVHHRQKLCPECETDINIKNSDNNRIYRYIYNNEDTVYIDDKEFYILSILQWFNENADRNYKIIKEQKKTNSSNNKKYNGNNNISW